MSNPKLEQVYRQIPTATCPPGCGECCGILFLSLAEIRNVKDWCETHGITFKDFSMLEGIDCPYLNSDKRCIIYPVRPFLCRIVAVSVDLPCPLHKCQPEKVLNHPVSSYLYSEIYLRGKEKPRTEKHRRLLRPLIQEFLAPQAKRWRSWEDNNYELHL